jgi:hypothetical protein
LNVSKFLSNSVHPSSEVQTEAIADSADGSLIEDVSTDNKIQFSVAPFSTSVEQGNRGTSRASFTQFTKPIIQGSLIDCSDLLYVNLHESYVEICVKPGKYHALFLVSLFFDSM